VSRRLFAALSLSFALGSCSEQGPAVFIAMDRDFAGFLQWRRVELGTVMLVGHAPGTRVAFINTAQRPSGSAYPVGTIIVKAITQNSADTNQWAVIAMAKRGGDFNREGARDWEFFTLRMQGESVSIVERGLAPRTDGDGDPYGVTAGITCNTCHGSADARMVDSILTPELRPADAGL